MNGAARPLYWLIMRHDNNRMNLLTVGLANGEKVLPVFSHREEAGAFVQRLGPGGTGLRDREATARELVSVLLGPCAGVGRVVLDPVPEIEAEVLVALVGVGREDFLNRLIGEEGKPLDPPSEEAHFSAC